MESLHSLEQEIKNNHMKNNIISDVILQIQNDKTVIFFQLLCFLLTDQMTSNVVKICEIRIS